MPLLESGPEHVNQDLNINKKSLPLASAVLAFELRRRIMSNQESDYQDPEEEITNYEIPTLVKIGVSGIAVIILIAALVIIEEYIQSPRVAASPKDLGLTPLIIFSLTALIVTWTPWKKLGVRVSKIGGLEFEKIVQEQAAEHIEDQNDLNKRIKSLENQLLKLDSTLEFTDQSKEDELSILLLDFLTQYSTWAFSPARIRAWGSVQPGHDKLVNFTLQLIRSTLQKMVFDGVLVTRVSKKGNTLYRVPKS